MLEVIYNYGTLDFEHLIDFKRTNSGYKGSSAVQVVVIKVVGGLFTNCPKHFANDFASRLLALWIKKFQELSYATFVRFAVNIKNCTNTRN